MIYKNIIIENINTAIEITLNRENQLNILTKELLNELKHFLQNLDIKNSSGILIVGSGNKAFSAGGDLKHMMQLNEKGGRDLSQLAQTVTLLIEQLPLPVIACVDGFALGGGCELAMSCDFIYATQKSKFGQPEVKVGLMPGFGGIVRLAKLIGPALAKELIYTGRIISAFEAEKMGLVNKLFKDRDELMLSALKTIDEIARNSSNAITAVKAVFNNITSNSMNEALNIENKAFMITMS